MHSQVLTKWTRKMATLHHHRHNCNRRLTICRQSWRLIAILKLKCKTVAHIHQLQAQAVTRGCLCPHNETPLLPQLLHSFTSFLRPLSTPAVFAHLHFATAIFGLIRKPSSFCYNAVIRSHTLLSSPHTAITFFIEMQRSGVAPDSHTFPFVLKACALFRSIFLSRGLHCQALRLGFLVDVYVVNNLVHAYSLSGGVDSACKVFDGSSRRDVVSYNVMIDGFVKAGEIVKGREVFDKMSVRDSFSWGALIAGYARTGHCREAISLFDEMLVSDVQPCNTSLVSVLSACSQLGNLEKGKAVHDHIRQTNGVSIGDAYLATGLVDMYAKCGSIETAMDIFQTCCEKNIFTWNAMLFGLAIHGDGKLLLDHFSRMMDSGTPPDGVTFLGMLVGCSHTGLVDVARILFGEMESVYGVPRELKHYGCMADLFGRAGLIKEAVEMIEMMPMKGDVFVWGGLLGGCRTHGNLELAEKAARRIAEIEPKDGGASSVMASVYADRERWDDLVKVRRRGAANKKIVAAAGCSVIQVNGFGAVALDPISNEKETSLKNV
ncbi:unnamed protein product [Cuscuta epithymum]|uniref:Pentatricopeptide repeat-containing protein n=1 Tax=Cuscuta epithymum TaxID=186058 RepID=A0AAV0D7R8_9ASTE|nr:unnamed protein product [Cuscuta epithymum]